MLLVLFGQIVALAFAAGLNLYATVALLGLATRLGWVAGLPTELRGLENPIIVATAVALYLVEFVVDKIPRLDTVWDTLHGAIRPAAAATLAVASAGDAPLEVRIAMGVLAGGVALLAHGTKAGMRVTLLGDRGTAAHAGMSLVEDLLAIGIVGGSLRFPEAAPAIAGGAVVSTLPFLPRQSRAFLLGIRGALARLRSLFLGSHWRQLKEMPRALRVLMDPARFGFGNPAATRVAVRGLPGVGAYRNGWLAMAPEGPVFLYRSRFQSRSLPLPPGHVTLERGFWADLAFVQGEHARYTVYFLKDGPAPELVLAELARPMTPVS